MVRLIPDSEPAPTIGAAGLATGRDVWVWPLEAPATTVAADPRLTSRSHHEHGEQGREAVGREAVGRDEIEAGEYDGRSPVRVTLEEAATLQGFPHDYPWQGSRTKRFEQVGNAVPPPLARAVITALLASSLPTVAGQPVKERGQSDA